MLLGKFFSHVQAHLYHLNMLEGCGDPCAVAYLQLILCQSSFSNLALVAACFEHPAICSLCSLGRSYVCRVSSICSAIIF